MNGGRRLLLPMFRQVPLKESDAFSMGPVRASRAIVLPGNLMIETATAPIQKGLKRSTVFDPEPPRLPSHCQ